MNPTTDRFTVRSVVLGLIIIALAIVVALLVILIVVPLTPEQQTMVLTVLGSIGLTALGAVAGVLAHTASQEPVPAPQPGQPVQLPIVGGNVDVGPMPPAAPPVAPPTVPEPPAEPVPPEPPAPVV